MKFATNSPTLPIILRYVATLPWDIKNSNFLQIFSRYRKNANKLHFQCTDFNSSMHLTLYAECTCVFLSKSCSCHWLIVDKHCSDVCYDEFPMPRIDRKCKQVKNSDMENFICNQYWWKLVILSTENIEICGWITKVEAIKMQIVCIFVHMCWISAENVNVQFPKVMQQYA